MGIPAMSTADEERIAGAIDAAEADPRIDEDPDAAIAKAAAAGRVPPGHVAILVRAYNNSRTAAQREAGADAREKAAEFPLASEEAVLEAAYPSRPETKAARERREGLAPEYAAPPDWSRFRAPAPLPDAGPLAKRAGGPPAPPPPPTDPDGPYLRAAARCRDALRALDAAALADDSAARRAKAAIDALADRLSLSGAAAAADLRPLAEARRGDYGAAALAAAVRSRPGLSKAAGGGFLRASRAAGELEALEAAADALRACDEARERRLGAGADALAKVAAEMAPFLPPEAPDPSEALLEGIVEKRADAADFARQFASAAAIGKIRGMMDYDDEIDRRGRRPYDDVVDQLIDPSHEAKVRDLEDQYALQSMLVDDPVLSSYPPGEVAAAYNEISAANPHLARRPLLVRPLLRKALASGSPDSFDADQALGSEARLSQLARGPAEAAKLHLETAKLRRDLAAPPRARDGSGDRKPQAAAKPPAAAKPQPPAKADGKPDGDGEEPPRWPEPSPGTPGPAEAPPPEAVGSGNAWPPPPPGRIDWTPPRPKEPGFEVRLPEEFDLAEAAKTAAADPGRLSVGDAAGLIAAAAAARGPLVKRADGVDPAAIWASIRDEASRLPGRFRALDPRLQGALAGAGAGGLLGLARGKGRRRSLGQALYGGLLGAGLGGGAAALAGREGGVFAPVETPEGVRENFDGLPLATQLSHAIAGNAPEGFSAPAAVGRAAGSAAASGATAFPLGAAGGALGLHSRGKAVRTQNLGREISKGLSEMVAQGHPRAADAARLQSEIGAAGAGLRGRLRHPLGGRDAAGDALAGKLHRAGDPTVSAARQIGRTLDDPGRARLLRGRGALGRPLGGLAAGVGADYLLDSLLDDPATPQGYAYDALMAGPRGLGGFFRGLQGGAARRADGLVSRLMGGTPLE